MESALRSVLSRATVCPLWPLGKLAISQIEVIMMTQNVADEAGMEQGAALIREQFVSGQLLATIVGGLIAFAIAPVILAVYPSGKPVTAEDAAAQKRDKEKSKKQENAQGQRQALQTGCRAALRGQKKKSQKAEERDRTRQKELRRVRPDNAIIPCAAPFSAQLF